MKKTVSLLAATVLGATLTGCSAIEKFNEPPTPDPGHMLLVQHPETSPGSDMSSRIDSAKTMVWMEMYSLNDSDVVDSLIRAHKRGVNVHVMLNHGYGVSDSTKKSYAKLQTNKVPVKWSPTGYIFHIKTTIIDDDALISTANLNRNNYVSHRDYTIVDSNQDHVKAITKTFANDWALKNKPRTNTVKANGLVWSPDAQDTFVSTIGSAKKSIKMSSEELRGKPVANALANAARRGVSCQVMIPYDKQATNILPENIDLITKAGCTYASIKEEENNSIYEHGKVIIIDGVKALVGSQNDSMTSLTKNRELSVMVNDPDIVKPLNSTFEQDFAMKH